MSSAGAAAAGPSHESEDGASRRTPRPRGDGLRRRHRRRRAGRTGGGDPAEAARRRPLRRRRRKGLEVGAHILSGAVIDPIGLDRLLPDWRDDPERPLKTRVTDDRFLFLGPSGGVRLPNWPMPPLMSNHGNFIGSLGALARWLGARAEALGVEIYPGFAAAELLYGDKGEVVGVATGDMGVGRDGAPKPSFTRGMELRGKYVLLAEGARGSLTKQAIARFALDDGREPQKFGIGLKEIWQVEPATLQPGLVAAQLRLAARRRRDRRLVPLSLRRPPGVGRLRRPSQLHQSDAVAVRRVPALQDPSADPRRLRGRQAHRLWRAGAHRGRLAVGPEARLSRRRADRLRGRLRQRAAHQGLAQRDAVGHAGGRGGAEALAAGRANDELDRLRRAPGAAPTSAAISIRCATSSRCGRSSASRSASPRRPRHVDESTVRRFAVRHAEARQARLRHAEAAQRGQADRLSQARRQDHLRQALVGLPLQHQSRGGPAGPSAAERSRSSRSATICRATASRRGSIARPASTRSSMATRRSASIRASSSTRRTACTARPATSRIPRRTSTGRRPKAAADRTIPTCERTAAKAWRLGAKPPRLPAKRSGL